MSLTVSTDNVPVESQQSSAILVKQKVKKGKHSKNINYCNIYFKLIIRISKDIAGDRLFFN